MSDICKGKIIKVELEYEDIKELPDFKDDYFVDLQLLIELKNGKLEKIEIDQKSAKYVLDIYIVGSLIGRTILYDSEHEFLKVLD